MIRKLIGIGIFIVIFCPFATFAKDTTADAHRKLSDIQYKISLNQRRIQERKFREKQLVKDLIVLNRNLTYTTYQLKRAQGDLVFYENKADQTRSNMESAQLRYQAKRNRFQNRLVDIYKNKNLGFLEFLFSPKNYITAWDSSYLFERIIRSDADLIDDILNEYHNLHSQVETLHDQTTKIKALQSEITSHQQEITQEQQEKSVVVSSLRQQIEAYERENAELIRISQQITALIQRSRKTSTFGTGRFIAPVNGWISSGFGYRMHPILRRNIMHTGIDFAVGSGTPIRAADSGEVVYAGWLGGYGNVTIIDHGRNISTVYAHQSRILIAKGQKVEKGQVIGYVGSTGLSTGPHLHFEVRVNGQPVNPMQQLSR